MTISLETETSEGRKVKPFSVGGEMVCLVPLGSLTPQRDTTGKLRQPSQKPVKINHPRFDGYAVEATIKLVNISGGEQALRILGDKKTQIGLIRETEIHPGSVLFEKQDISFTPKPIYLRSTLSSGLGSNWIRR